MATPKKIDLAHARQIALKVKDEHVTCRAMRQHVWTYTTVEERNRGRILVQGLHCPRCNAVDKFQEIDSRTGYILRSWSRYDPEAEYLIAGQGRVTPELQGQFRLRSLGVLT